MKKVLAICAFTLLSFGAPAFGDTDRQIIDNSREENTSSGKDLIVNFSKVNEGIYRGARLTSIHAVQYLKSLEIKNVINLQGGDMLSKFKSIIPWAEPGERPENIALEKKRAESLGIGYLHTPLNSLDPITPEEDVAIDETLAFMHDKTNWPIFIHCEHGADRTGLLIALYRVKYEDADAEEAREEWIKNGHNTLHQIFTGDLDDYYYQKVREFKLL